MTAMRTEQEMLSLIVTTAADDDRIRAVILNGSRTNPNVPRDFFQDFDVVYLVADVASFTADHGWIDRFGERMILQMPEAMQDPPPAGDGAFVYLMQFADGNRIDLCLAPLSRAAELPDDSLSVLLLDKDNRFTPFPPPSDAGYLPTPPTAKAFADCCNEFWWVAPYVAKGLWRQEIIYARHMLDQFMRTQLMKMLVWHAGVDTGFSRSPGKFGKYFRQTLPPRLWELLLKTYAGAGYEKSWQALFAMGDLFRAAALDVAAPFNFPYPRDDDRRVTAHLHHVHTLPADAPTLY